MVTPWDKESVYYYHVIIIIIIIIIIIMYSITLLHLK